PPTSGSAFSCPEGDNRGEEAPLPGVGAFVTPLFFPPRRLLPLAVEQDAARVSAPSAGGAAGALPSLDEIFRAHAPFAWRALRRLGVAEADVDDVCQDVFMVVHRKLDAFEGRSSMRTWIYGICARTASDYRRSGRVRR